MSEVLISRNEEETLQIGRRIGARIAPPKTILLIGDLGSGKTVLTRGICQGMGLDPEITVHSPTFTLINQYPARDQIIYHIDLYRLETMRDLYSIGIEDILDDESAVIIVEWAEKLQTAVQDPITVYIHRTDRSGRRLIKIEPPFPEHVFSDLKGPAEDEH